MGGARNSTAALAASAALTRPSQFVCAAITRIAPATSLARERGAKKENRFA